MVLEYKGYVGQVEYDEDDAVFHGSVMNTRDVITFVGSTAAELRQALVESVEDYLAFCAERGEAPEKPFSGKFVVRVPAEVHRAAATAAARAGKSLNAWTRGVLEKAAANE
jgi:predicted HicB family RNase H-like nuclease